MGVVFPVLDLFLFEPEGDFSVGWFDWVWSVADVSSSDDAEISSDGSRVWLKRVGGSQKKSSSGNDSSSFPDHGDDWAWKHVLDEVGEEGSGGKILVVLFKEGLSGWDEFECSQVVSFLLESGNDGSDQSSLDTVGFDHDVGSFCWRWHLLK